MGYERTSAVRRLPGVWRVLDTKAAHGWPGGFSPSRAHKEFQGDGGKCSARGARVNADFWIRANEKFCLFVRFITSWEGRCTVCSGMTPEECPVCGGNELTPIVRTALVRAAGDSQPISGTLAFRCGNGHVFLTRRTEASRTAAESLQN